GLGPQDLIATGPAKSKVYLGSLLQAEVKSIVIESENQLRDLNELCGKLGRTQDVLLRVQLDWQSDEASFLGGKDITPFGWGSEDWKQIDVRSFKNLNIQGLHCFQWGNLLELSDIQRTWTATIEGCQKLALDLGIELKVLDLGGGLGLSYKDEREVSFIEVHAM